MASKREQVIAAVVARLDAELTGAEVRRNIAQPTSLPPGGMVIVRDGDPGEPEIDLSPLTYNYRHRIGLEVATLAFGELTREQALDQLLAEIGAAVAIDPTFGGLCTFAEAEAPDLADLAAPGTPAGRWADAAIFAEYASPSPLT